MDAFLLCLTINWLYFNMTQFFSFPCNHLIMICYNIHTSKSIVLMGFLDGSIFALFISQRGDNWLLVWCHWHVQYTYIKHGQQPLYRLFHNLLKSNELWIFYGCICWRFWQSKPHMLRLTIILQQTKTWYTYGPQCRSLPPNYHQFTRK